MALFSKWGLIMNRVALAAICSVVLIFGIESHGADTSAFDGVYVFSGGDADREGVDEAIEVCAKEITFVFRGYARGQLKDACPVPEEIDFATEGDMVTIGGPDKVKSTGRYDGVEYEVTTLKGEEGHITRTVTAQEDGGWQLVEASRVGASRRLHTFTLSADGKTLTMGVRLEADTMPKPVAYSLSYTRR